MKWNELASRTFVEMVETPDGDIPKMALVKSSAMEGEKQIMMQPGDKGFALPQTYGERPFIRGDGVVVYVLNSLSPNAKFREATPSPEETQMQGLVTRINTIGKSLSCPTGTDPEIFVVDGRGQVIPAFQFLPPQHSAIGAVGAVVFNDGFQAEMNVDPAGCHAYLVDRMRAGFEQILAAARGFNPKAKLSWKAVVPLTNKMIGECTPEQLQLGCSPSSNAYGEPPLATDGTGIPVRFAGFHVHLGLSHIPVYFRASKIKKSDAEMVKGIDALAGVLGVALLRDIDDPLRRRYYGRAGEYRSPNHGLEYRVHSAAALCHPALTHFTLDTTRWATHLVRRDALKDFWKVKGEDQVRDVINNCNVREALNIIRDNMPTVRAMCGNFYAQGAPKIFQMIMEGAKNFIAHTEVEGNWKLGQTWKRHSDGPQQCVRTI